LTPHRSFRFAFVNPSAHEFQSRNDDIQRPRTGVRRSRALIRRSFASAD
jgi:hypothetical protein